MEDKIGFGGCFKNLFVGLARPERYIENGQRGKVWPAVIWVIGVTFLLYLFTFWIPYNKLFGGGRLADTIDESVEDFSITNDGFYYGDRFQWSDNENLTYILIDTNIKDSGAKEVESIIKENVYKTVCVITSSEAVIIDSGRRNVFSAKDLYQFLDSVYHAKSFGKQDILSLIRKWDTPVLVCIYIACVVIGILKMFWTAFVVAIVGIIIASFKRLKFSLGTMYKAALYIRPLWYSIMLLAATYLWPAKRTLLSLAFLICAIYMLVAVFRYSSENPEEDNRTGMYKQ